MSIWTTSFALLGWRTKVIIALEVFYCKLKHLLFPCIAGGFIKDAIQTNAENPQYTGFRHFYFLFKLFFLFDFSCQSYVIKYQNRIILMLFCTSSIWFQNYCTQIVPSKSLYSHQLYLLNAILSRKHLSQLCSIATCGNNGSIFFQHS